jgi:hypothetical protein
VWKDPIRSIRANHTEKSKWDGGSTVRKQVQPGFYQIHLSAWHGLEDANPDWALVQTADVVTIE